MAMPKKERLAEHDIEGHARFHTEQRQQIIEQLNKDREHSVQLQKSLIKRER